GQHESALRYYEQSLALMRRLGNLQGMADVWRMKGRAYAAQRRYDEALHCCRTSLAIAERQRDELRLAGAWYLMAECFEGQGCLRDAVDLLAKVVRVDEKYRFPKLEENTRRLEALRAKLDGNGQAALSRKDSPSGRGARP
ncbi:MAG: tetratricopeptide repeat protein, partial [Nitrospirales bacterium]